MLSKKKKNYGRVYASSYCVFWWNEPPLDIVTALVNVCPDAAVEKDERGFLHALYYACSDKVSFGRCVDVLLLKVWPDMLCQKEKNNNGWTPLHEACLEWITI